MKNNPKLLIALGTVAITLIVGMLWNAFDHETRNPESKSSSEHDLFDVASGDTNNEVLKSIIARQKSLQKKNDSLFEANRKLREQNSLKSSKAIEESKSTFQEQISKTREEIEKKFKNEIEKIKKAAYQGKRNDDLDYSISVPGDHQISGSHIIKSVPDLALRQKMTFTESVKSKLGSSSKIESDDEPSLPSSNFDHQNKSESEPYYTIPDGSTIANTVLASPLVGEIPVNGQLLAPALPFKAEISYKDTENMFSANGVPLPEGISGMILQGYSVGNMSMGCTRAYVKKILFVFQDGHYVVFPSEKNSNAQDATEVYPKDTLGYLSDYYNNPCISGKYLTNAPKVLSSLTAFGAVSGAGGAIAQAQQSTLTSAQQSTTIFDGSVGKFAAGYGIGEGSRAALEWYKARVHDVFDAIFVPSSVNRKPTKLIFNVTKTIPIDLKKAGRRLSYEHSSTMSARDTSFN